MARIDIIFKKMNTKDREKLRESDNGRDGDLLFFGSLTNDVFYPHVTL